uniref:Uncharacterized protein n=1 Tax=Solanum lycopersicum TaxID=4081 RepID=A0A3Q7I0Q5_SOLLC
LSSPPRRCSILCSTIVASSPFSYGGLTFPTLMLLSLISNFKGVLQIIKFWRKWQRWNKIDVGILYRIFN